MYLAKANCTENYGCTSCDKVVLELNIYLHVRPIYPDKYVCIYTHIYLYKYLCACIYTYAYSDDVYERIYTNMYISVGIESD